MHPPSSSLGRHARRTHAGDFPDVGRYREILSAFDISRFPKLDKSMIRQVGGRGGGDSVHCMLGTERIVVELHATSTFLILPQPIYPTHPP